MFEVILIKREQTCCGQPEINIGLVTDLLIFIIDLLSSFTQEAGGSATALLSAEVLFPEDGPAQPGRARCLPGQR